MRELLNITNISDMELVDFDILNNPNKIFFCFCNKKNVSIVMFSFKMNSNKIIIKRDPSIFKYNINGIEKKIVFDSKNNRLLIVSNCKNKSTIWSIKWFNTLQSLSFNFEKIKENYGAPDTYFELGQGSWLIYDDCNIIFQLDVNGILNQWCIFNHKL